MPNLVPIIRGSEDSLAKMVGCSAKKVPVKKPYATAAVIRRARLVPVVIKQKLAMARMKVVQMIMFIGPRCWATRLGRMRPRMELELRMARIYKARFGDAMSSRSAYVWMWTKGVYRPRKTTKQPKTKRTKGQSFKADGSIRERGARLGAFGSGTRSTAMATTKRKRDRKSMALAAQRSPARLCISRIIMGSTTL